MASATMTRRQSRFAAVAAIAAVAVTAGSWLSPAIPKAEAADWVVILVDSGTHQVVVPEGATAVHVQAQGGSGASSNSQPGGAGAFVVADLPVTSGEPLTVVVGANSTEWTGGFNGGADGRNSETALPLSAGGGGGATDIRRAGSALTDRVLVAGGGGGASSILGGHGGAASGTVGGAGLTAGGCSGDSGGGTQSAGGAPGAPCDGTPGEAGVLGIGGIPGFRNSGNNLGGGGGGGFFGGGGGSPYGGGGAGSSYVDPAGSGVSMVSGILGASPQIMLTFRMPVAASISVELPFGDPVAGAGGFLVEARVLDGQGRPVLGETVSFTSSDAGQDVGQAQEIGDGRYRVDVNSSTTLGPFTITARNISVDPAITGSVTGTQTVGPPANFIFVDPPTTGPADGVSEFPVTLIVTDAQGRRVDPGPLQVRSSDAAQDLSSITYVGNGVFSGMLRTSTLAGAATVSAHMLGWVHEVRTSFEFTQTAGPVHALEAALASPQMIADGAAQTTLAITADDEFGNPIAGQTLGVTSSDPEVGLGAVQDLGDGDYSVDVTSSTAAGDVTLTVTDASVTPALVKTVTLTQVAGEPTGAQLTLGEPWLYADGTSETTLVAEVVDEFGNPVSALPIGATSTDPGQRFSDATETADGVYEVRVRASQTVGTSTLSIGLISVPALERRSAEPAIQAITLDQPQIQDAQPAPLAEVLATTELEQRARAVVPGKDPAPEGKPAALAGTGSAPALGGWGAAALLAAGGVLLLSRRALRRS